MASRSLYIGVATGIVLMVALAALILGGIGSEETARETPQTTIVKIVKGSFSSTQRENFVPKTVRVVIGVNSTLVFINEDTDWHDVKGPGFLSPRLNPGDQYRFTFTKPGEYSITCTPHPWMSGTVIVQNP